MKINTPIYHSHLLCNFLADLTISSSFNFGELAPSFNTSLALSSLGTSKAEALLLLFPNEALDLDLYKPEPEIDISSNSGLVELLSDGLGSHIVRHERCCSSSVELVSGREATLFLRVALIPLVVFGVC